MTRTGCYNQMRIRGTLASLVCATGAWALGSSSESVRHVLERRDSAPYGFVKVHAAPLETTFELRIQLANSDIAGLEERLKVVSSPSNSEYGQWLTRKEVDAFTSPAPDTASAVNAFLSEHGLSATPVTSAGDVLTVDVTVEQANALLDTEYYTFKSADTGAPAIRTLEYSVPASLKGHIAYIHPTTSFPISAKSGVHLVKTLDEPMTSSTDPVNASCAEIITPKCIQQLYGLPTTPATSIANPNDSITVTAYSSQYAQREDLKDFLEIMRPDINANTTFEPIYLGEGAQNPQGLNFSGLEADLDVEYTVGLATGVPVRFISVSQSASNDSTGGFLATADALAANASTSHVVTTSYGIDEDLMSVPVAQSLCNTYMQLSAMGITVIFASGDGGVAGGGYQTCTTFGTTFPSGCPYVLSVGGTVYNGTESGVILSSGGFSNIFPRPWYQDTAVPEYLDTLGDEYAGLYSASGRGIPDVAAIGANVEVACGDVFGLVAGTSISAPVFASTIALLNDRLLAVGKPTLGFIQPLLYENPHALTDIILGNNPGCNTTGFSASAGWDPVTGLGVPNFDSMLKVVGIDG
ncbi:family S53 protease [Peniophora sp. CONT]|nr:family S53 protease [Peniophora sp. CONT]